jgi:hypothetical protein
METAKQFNMKDTYTKEEVIALLEEQKKAVAIKFEGSNLHLLIKTDILSTPLVVETSLICIDKERLEDVREALQWTWGNLTREVCRSDAFNIPANAMAILDEVLQSPIKNNSSDLPF